MCDFSRYTFTKNTINSALDDAIGDVFLSSGSYKSRRDFSETKCGKMHGEAFPRLPGNPPNVANIKEGERKKKRERASWVSKITAMREEARGQNEFGGSGWGRESTMVVFWLLSGAFAFPRVQCVSPPEEPVFSTYINAKVGAAFTHVASRVVIVAFRGGKIQGNEDTGSQTG